MAEWDDPMFDWSAVDLAVIRSTWDYTTRLDEFLAWTERCEGLTRLVNPAAVVAWNSDKRYLDDLSAAGIPVVPTTFVSAATVSATPGLGVSGLVPSAGEFVVKPTVSAGSADTTRHRAEDPDDVAAAVASVERLVAAGRTVMVQPYQRAVDDEGETAFLFFGGEFSHAVNKGPLLTAGAAAHDDLYAEETITRTTPSPEAEALARRCHDALASVPALADVSFPLAYARIDVVTANDGRPAILEVELIEPSVFVDWSDDGAARCAKVLVGVATATGHDRPSLRGKPSHRQSTHRDRRHIETRGPHHESSAVGGSGPGSGHGRRHRPGAAGHR